MSEAAPFQPPIERGELGILGVFGFTALLFSGRRTPSRRWRRSTFPRSSPSRRSSPWLRTGSAGVCRCCGCRGKRSVSGLMALVMLGTTPFSVWPGGALGTFTDIYFKVVLVFLLMVNSVRNVRTLRWLTWLILSAMGYVAARGVLDYVHRYQSRQRRTAARVDLRVDGQPQRSGDEHGHVPAARVRDRDLARAPAAAYRGSDHRRADDRDDPLHQVAGRAPRSWRHRRHPRHRRRAGCGRDSAWPRWWRCSPPRR